VANPPQIARQNRGVKQRRYNEFLSRYPMMQPYVGEAFRDLESFPESIVVTGSTMVLGKGG
jgi:hypothetical protein